MMTMPTCCIVIPIYEFQHSIEECKSIERALARLPAYSFRFVVKQSLSDSPKLREWCSPAWHKDAKSIFILDEFLSSISAYNHVMLSPWFYEAFEEWDYILIHQVDARIINEDRLLELLKMEYSYVGGPFVVTSNFKSRLFGRRIRVYGGNGGLSLRRVNHCIKLLNSPEFYMKSVRGFWDSCSYLIMRHYIEFSKPLSWIGLLRICFNAVRMISGYKNTLSTMEKTTTCQEDFILSVFAPRFFSWFRVAPPQIASCYIIDSYPEVFDDKVAFNQLLGCHGWEKHNEFFWRSKLSSIFS
jgi:hypothetical protein